MAAPVRGTQTFVGVMASVWRRPSLMALEIAWRWLAGLAWWILVGPIVLGGLGMDVHSSASSAKVDLSFLQALTVFQPVHATQVLHSFAASLLLSMAPSLRWIVPLASLVWLVLAALGRTLLLRRLDASLQARPLTNFVLGALRAALLTGFWVAWLWLLGWAVRSAILLPAAAQQEPNLVAFSAIAICGTLLLYVVWGIVSWPFQLAPLLAVAVNKGPMASLSAAFRVGSVRGKLMEINLVMNIVKLALIVLAMVLSASPLPFTNVATQTFLTCWWTGVLLLYFALSDYFHVVRAAAYLRLWRSYKLPATM